MMIWVKALKASKIKALPTFEYKQLYCAHPNALSQLGYMNGVGSGCDCGSFDDRYGKYKTRE